VQDSPAFITTKQLTAIALFGILLGFFSGVFEISLSFDTIFYVNCKICSIFASV